MVLNRDLLAYLDSLLGAAQFRDYCPNGLQVEGRPEIRKLVSGVTASLALIEAAVDVGADALLVHHGYFWKNEHPQITGMKRQRLRALLHAEINLFAYHLPLDAHAEFGNNAQLARVLQFTKDGEFGMPGEPALACYGTLTMPTSGSQFARHISDCLGREPLHIPASGRDIGRVGWCTGAAQSYLELAAGLNLDAFVSGEISETTVHTAREYGMHYFAAGHHATERYGVAALGQHVAARFGLEQQFIDIDNPV